ncbi:MAG: hypothetical protein WBF51_04140 [Candidatus Dormiibacterota bacterium]
MVEITTTSRFSHVAMYHSPGTLIESKEGYGVRLTAVETYPDAQWFRVQCDQATREAALAFAVSKLGQKYGYREAFQTAERDWLHHAAKRASGAHGDCSGLVWAAYRHAGLTLTWHPDPCPADVGPWSPLVDPL